MKKKNIKKEMVVLCTRSELNANEVAKRWRLWHDEKRAQNKSQMNGYLVIFIRKISFI